jgi:hypothetical protein
MGKNGDSLRIIRFGMGKKWGKMVTGKNEKW